MEIHLLRRNCDDALSLQPPLMPLVVLLPVLASRLR